MIALHLTNSNGRDATIGVSAIKAPAGPKMGLKNERVVFRRYIASTESGIHESLKAQYGDEYSKILIDADPEIDMEVVGQFITATQTVYLDGDNALIYSDPYWIEMILDSSGNEKERRDIVDITANINGGTPLRWSGRKIAIDDAIRRFVFKRQMQLRHIDGLTYEFLYSMAQELEKSSSVMLIGSGEKGTGPLVFQANGRSYRGFLHGRTNGKSYRLTLHLSDTELKKLPEK
jgi:hypothetical protein